MNDEERFEWRRNGEDGDYYNGEDGKAWLIEDVFESTRNGSPIVEACYIRASRRNEHGEKIINYLHGLEFGRRFSSWQDAREDRLIAIDRTIRDIERRLADITKSLPDQGE